jgi:prepilin-type N-terminal cleavage/methylation domain-containing protein
MKYPIAQNNKGFTLIELIIVITIIAILGATIISFINPFEIQKNSRDSVRISNLNSLAQALELYFAQNKSYPDSLSADNKTSLLAFNSRISWDDPTESCSITYQKTSSGYRMYLPKESTSFTIPKGQSLVSLAETPSGYSCGNVAITGIIVVEVK